MDRGENLRVLGRYFVLLLISFFSLIAIVGSSLFANQRISLIVYQNSENDSPISRDHLAIRSENEFGSDSSSWQKIEISYRNDQELEEKIQDLEDQGLDWEPEAVFSANVVNGGIDPHLEGLDTFVSNQWAIYNPIRYDSNDFGGGDIDLLRAHQYLEGKSLSKGQGILFTVDSGIDFQSPEFRDRIIGSYNSQDIQAPAQDDNDHGTHVASIATAAKNQFGILGIAPDSFIFAAKALNADNQGSTSDVLSSVQNARRFLEEYRRQFGENTPAVFNFSLGSPQRSQSLFQELQKLAQENVLIVASAGNEGTNNDVEAYFPCNYEIPNLICVGATDRYDIPTGFSNFGKESVDLYAPGKDIFANVRGASDGSNYIAQFGYKSGTSQAAPHVSGTALLVWGAAPSLSAADVKSILLESVDRVLGEEDSVLSGGRLNAYRALLTALGDDASLADRSFANQSKSGGGCFLNPDSSSSSVAFALILSLALLICCARLFWKRSFI